MTVLEIVSGLFVGAAFCWSLYVHLFIDDRRY